MSIRNGKIARLPTSIRDELNHRLDDGAQGKDLVAWLNGLPEVKSTLDAAFGGRPISEQNLSEWRHGGFADWRRREEARDCLGRLAQFSEDLDGISTDRGIPEHLANLLSAELAVETRKLLNETTDSGERWKYLCEALRQLHGLRRGDYIAARTRMELARWEIEETLHERKEAEAAMAEAKERVLEPIKEEEHRRAMVAYYGEKTAEFIMEVNRKYKYRPYYQSGDHPPNQAPIKPRSGLQSNPDQTESNRIKPNQTNSPPSGLY